MTGQGKLHVVLFLRQLEEDISKARLAQSVERLDASRRAMESTNVQIESFRHQWREAVEALDSVERLRLFPAGRGQLATRLERQGRALEGRAREAEDRRQEYAARHRTRRLLEGLVARRVRRKALLQEVREQDERDEQAILGYGSS